MTVAPEADAYACPKCGERSTKSALTTQSYHCARCTMEVAHLELAPNGSVRHMHGWLCTVGQLLHDRYRVDSLLGKGGFGATYLVTDERVGKRRAVKEIPKDLFDQAETDLLARLEHPAIPDILDRFESDGMVYLVLEFGGTRSLEGERRSAGGKIPVARLLPWMRQLCDVLTYLHERTPPVVHRDLKPENILLDEQERIMLIDFGVAKQTDAGSATRTIARSATHGFSPPEQVLGTGTDQRSDVYALGATIYALLSGTVPPAAHERVAGRELAGIQTLEPSVPAGLDAAITASLDLNINKRPQSIRAFQALLDPSAVAAAPVPLLDAGGGPRTERITSSRPTGPAAAPATTRLGGTATGDATMTPGNSFATVAIGGAVLLAVIMGLIWFLMRGKSSTDTTVPAKEQATTTVAPTTVPATSAPMTQPPVAPGATIPAVPTTVPIPAAPTATLPTAPSSPPATAAPSTPPGDGGSALEQIEQMRRNQPTDTSPPRPVDTTPTPRAVTPPRPAPPPRPKPAPPMRPKRSAPADGGWNIRPEGSNRTD